MFTGLNLGFALADVTGQITAFLGNTVVTGLVAASIALAVIPRILHVAKGAFGRH